VVTLKSHQQQLVDCSDPIYKQLVRPLPRAQARRRIEKQPLLERIWTIHQLPRLLSKVGHHRLQPRGPSIFR